MVLFETHCHTAESSSCSKIEAADLVKCYQSAGFAGLCVTDHFNEYNLREKPEVQGLEEAQRIRLVFEGYRRAVAAAGKDFCVLCGTEIRFCGSENDYLVYGPDERFYLQHPDVTRWGIRRFGAYAKEQGWLVIQAHPFRYGMTVTHPDSLDMIEVHNGHGDHDSHNLLAMQWATAHRMPVSSGSDCHSAEGVGRGGVMFRSCPHSIRDFIRMMRNGPALIVSRL